MEITELLTLFKNGEYERVINETNQETKIDKLFLRAISQALLNRYEDACKTLDENETILKDNLAKLIDVRMEICFWANKLFDAKKALDHYEEYPYVNQEVEEKFLYYKKEIDKKLADSSKNKYDEEGIIKLLHSEESDKIQLAFAEIKKFEVSPFVDEIKAILKNDKIDHSTRCLGLILLYEKRISCEVEYKWHNEMLKVVPSQLKTPFQDPKFRQLLAMKEEYKDVAFSQTFETLLATYYLYMYPKAVEEDVDDLYKAFEIVSRKYLGLGQNKMRQSPTVERLIKAIDDANSLF